MKSESDFSLAMRLASPLVSKQLRFASLHRCSRESPDFHPLLENTARGAWVAMSL